jgi:hypothetical protein
MKKSLFIATFAICLLMTSFVAAGWITGHATRSVTMYASQDSRSFFLGGEKYVIRNLGSYAGDNDQTSFSVESEDGSPSKWCEGYKEGQTCRASNLGFDIEIINIGHYFFGAKKGQISNIRVKITEIESGAPTPSTDCGFGKTLCEEGDSCSLDRDCATGLYCKNRKCTALPDTWVCKEVENQLVLTGKDPSNPRLPPKIYYRNIKYCSGDYLKTRTCVEGVSVSEGVSNAYTATSTLCENGCYEFGSLNQLARCRDSSTDDDEDDPTNQDADEIIAEIESLLEQLKALM